MLVNLDTTGVNGPKLPFGFVGELLENLFPDSVFTPLFPTRVNCGVRGKYRKRAP